MTRRDLVKAAIQHRTANRVPYCIDVCDDAWQALQKAGVTGGKTLDDFLDNDVQDIGVPWWGWYNLGQDWQGPATPTSPAKVIGFGNYESIHDRIRDLRQKSDKYFLVRIYGSHFEKAYFSRGIENFLSDMAGDPPFARKLLNGIIEKNLVMLENILAVDEVDGILLGSDWGSQMDLLMSPETWLDMIGPGERREYDLIHSYGKDVWVHSCGCIERIIPHLVDMGLDVLNPVQPECMDIRMLKEKYGRKLAFWGGISTQKTLPYGSPEEVRANVRSVRDLMSRDGGYILSPAQSIQSDVPVANIMALLETARERT